MLFPQAFSLKKPHPYILGGATICSSVCCTLLLLSSLLLRIPSSIHKNSHWNPHTHQLLCSILHCWTTCLDSDSNLLGHLIFLFGLGAASAFIVATFFSTFVSSCFSHFACSWHFFSLALTCPQIQDVLLQIIFLITQHYSHISSYTRHSYLHPQFKM